MITADPALAARSQTRPRKGALFLFGLAILLITPLLSTTAALAQQLPDDLQIFFDRISADDGISHTAAQRIMQDSEGFIWIGTQQGLNRYDGYKFEIFNYLPDDARSLSNGWIYDIFEDSDGQIWIATDGGLNLFEPSSRTFRHFRHNPEDPRSLPDNSVRAITQSADGNLWVGTHGGLSRLDPDGGFSHFLVQQTASNTESRPGVRALESDDNGVLWVGMPSQGLIRLDTGSGAITHHDFAGDQPNAEGDNYARVILQASDGTIWVGSQAGGISLLHEDGRVTRLRHNPDDANSISSNRVRSIYEDNQQRIWVGTEAGLNLWLPEQSAFRHYRHDPANPYSLSDDTVYDIWQDEGNVLWVGTFNGVSKWNSEIAAFVHVKRDEAGETTRSNNKVSSLAEDAEGNIWIGTTGGGINHWNLGDNSFVTHTANERDDTSLADNLVMSLLLDDAERLWVGTMRRGLSRMEGESGQFTRFSYDRNDPTTLSSNAVSAMLQDSRGRIWVATYGGGLNRYTGDGRFQRLPSSNDPAYEFPSYFLVDIEESLDGKLWLASDGGGVLQFDPETERVTAMQHSASSSNSISGNHIICVLQTESGLWVGTRDTGLNLYRDGQWTHYNYLDGLPSSIIYGLLEDEQGRIWISHSKGLSNYDPGEAKFTNYSTIHGLQGNDFNNGAYLRTRDGKMLFGGANGFNAFYPADIQVNTHQPPVRLTGFTKFNREVPLEKPVYELDSIKLNYDDYVVGFEFAALDFTDPQKNQYRYMLAGFDREWVSTNGIRQATYTNLGPGRYTFRVEGSNNDGVWSQERLSIDLEVTAAPWATWWAMALYTMVAIIVVYGAAQAYSVRLHREEQRRYSEQLEALVAERTSALENEITGHKTAQQELSRSLQEKEVLLKEVHHRVKNNMQVISSLLNIQADSVMEDRFVNLLTESQQRIKSMALIHENLYRSDNLLEINFHDYIEALANGLLRFYRFDNLAIRLELDVVDIYLDIDTAVPCGLIINELVSNSLKHAFTGRTGDGLISVVFNASADGNSYRFSVTDNGNGLPDDLEIENASSMGLEIVRILTEQLDGTWSCRSSGGTEFTIEFPRKK